MLYRIGKCLLLLSFWLCFSEGDNITVALYWHGGKIAPGCNTCIAGVNTSDYACSYNSRGDWANGMKSFYDPLPPNSLLLSITVVLFGAFDCMDTSSDPAQITLSLQRETFSSINLPQNLPCYCGNCVAPYSVFVDGNGDGSDWPGYQHQGNNSFQVAVVGSNQICLNRVELVLNYRIVPPLVTSIYPSAGPLGSETAITVYGTSFNNATTIICVFGQINTIAIVLDTTRLWCMVPLMNIAEQVIFGVFSGNTSAMYIPTQPSFLYYSTPKITEFKPQKGPVLGGTVVSLIGTGFFNSSDSRCRFGFIVLPAVFVSSNLILCVSQNRLNTTQTAPLVFLPNGQQTINVGNFVFVDPPPPSKLFYVYLGGGIFLGMLSIVLVCTVVRRYYFRKGYQKLKDGGAPIAIADIKLGRRIGKGNFGEVYIGVWCGTEVAIKKLSAHNLTEQLLKDFQKEVALLKAMRHPNVVQFVGSCTMLPDIFICTEYMSRGSLYDVLHNQEQPEISWPLMKKMVVDAAKGCLYLHSFSPMIIHRDLKSHNLLVDDTWKVKVADFGLSTVTENTTNQMTACGTPCWTAPEILRSEKYSEKADIFSFGVVMWECATRMDPFVGMPPFQVIFAVGREGLRLPEPRNSPPDFVRLMKDCWNEIPSRRPSMADIMQRLDVIDVTGYPPISVQPQHSSSINSS